MLKRRLSLFFILGFWFLGRLCSGRISIFEKNPLPCFSNCFRIILCIQSFTNTHNNEFTSSTTMFCVHFFHTHLLLGFLTHMQIGILGPFDMSTGPHSSVKWVTWVICRFCPI